MINAFFQKSNINEIDMSASEINDIERELKVEISSDADM